MSTSLESPKITLQWPDFTKQPINSFKLPKGYLTFRGDITHAREIMPRRFVDYDINLESDELFYRFVKPYQSKDKPFLNLILGELSYEVLQRGGGYGGGVHTIITIARAQNIPGVTDIQKPEELRAAIQLNFDRENDGERLGPDYCWINVDGRTYLQENRSGERTRPAYAFYSAIDYRNLLAIDFSFGGYIPLGEKLPPALFDALMDGVKEFLSHIQLEEIED